MAAQSTRQGLAITLVLLMTASFVGCKHAEAGEAPETPDAPSAPPGWTLTFSDEFDGDAVDTDKWEVLTREESHNEELQYYLPEMASIVDGKLRITATDEPYKDKAYRSARLESWYTQAYGRFEARAKVPTTQGFWPAFWLLPRSGNWPHDGEIDIMEHAGSDQEKVNCAYHFANADGKHAHVYKPYRATDGDGKPVRFPDGFHLYAAEWSPQDIVFFVDGNEYYRINRTEVPIPETPMAVIINSAVGGWFDGPPDENTVFPQYFDVDYVRVYQRDGGYPALPPEPIKPALNNGDFEQGGTGWSFYTNASVHTHDLEEEHQSIAYEGEGGKALKLYGQFGGTRITEARQQRITAEPGKAYSFKAVTRTNSDDPLTGSQNRLEMYIDFIGADGQVIDGAGEVKVAVDTETTPDTWHEHKLNVKAPADAETLAIGFKFYQPQGEDGAAWVDQVTLSAE